MRINGERASYYSTDTIRWMINNRVDLTMNALTDAQLNELRKVLNLRNSK